MSTSWRVVKFTSNEDETETIETVPITWLKEDGQQCYWPPFTNKKDLEKAIKSGWSPNKEWTVYNVKLVGNKEYNNFKQATAKATKALNFSEIDSELELPAKRIRKFNKRKFESSSEDTDENDEQPAVLPSYPLPPSSLTDKLGSQKPDCLLRSFSSGIERTPINLPPCSESTSTMGQKDNVSDSDDSFTELRVTTSRNDTTPNTSAVSSVTSTPQHKRIHSPALQISTESFKKIAKLAISNNKMLLEQRKILEDIQQRLVQQQGGGSGGSKSDQNIAVEVDSFVKETLPVKDEEGLQKFENRMVNNSDDNFKASLVKFLSLEGSGNYKESVRRIMTSVMTDDLALLYSYQGHKGKKKFSTMQLSHIVIGAVRQCDRSGNIMTKDVQAEISIWLSKAKERKQRKT